MSRTSIEPIDGDPPDNRGRTDRGSAPAENLEPGVRIYLREIGQIPLLTPKEEVALAARVKKGDREARSLMIKANLRLVVKIAHGYVNLGLPLLDLVSEGNIGLMKAVERFDPAKGAKLSTYAAWWIKQALANQGRTIRLPVHVLEKLSKMRRVSLQMGDENGREPTKEFGITRERIRQLQNLALAKMRAALSQKEEPGNRSAEN
jgi:RNA polymerase primary sigma factor